MKFAVIGSRGFNDYELLEDELKRYQITTVISGGAKGADSLARDYAIAKNLQYEEHLPDWDKHGKGAGIIRNRDIVNNSDVVIAFWDGKSKGTKYSIEYGIKQGKQVFVRYY